MNIYGNAELLEYFIWYKTIELQFNKAKSPLKGNKL